MTMSSTGHLSSTAHWSRWLPFILTWPQIGQAASAARSRASGGTLPKGHVRWLGESGQQPRLSPGASRKK
ncbi:hypothetical protein TNCV_429121 [Trichonephila clavipes]|nr:hypothetical protein TNCV_429121 [Trichonephila clavipes]